MYRKLIFLDQARGAESRWLIAQTDMDCKDIVMDVGCGTGQFTKKLSHFSRRVIGVDINIEQILFAKSQYPGPIYLVASSDALPFRNNAFNKVYSRCAIQQFPRQIESFKEISRVLKEGGHFLFSADSFSNKFVKRAYVEHHAKQNKVYAYYTSSSIETVSQNTGMKIETYSYLFRSFFAARIILTLSSIRWSWLWGFPIVLLVIYIDKIISKRNEGGLRILVCARQEDRDEL